MKIHNSIAIPPPVPVASGDASGPRDSYLVIPKTLHQTILERLLERRDETTALLRVGRPAVADSTELWLVREVMPDRSALAGGARAGVLLAATRHNGSGPMPFVGSQLDAYPASVAGEQHDRAGCWSGTGRQSM